MADATVSFAYTPNPRLEDELVPGIRAMLLKATQLVEEAGVAAAPSGDANPPPTGDRPAMPLKDNFLTEVSGNGPDQTGWVVCNSDHAYWVEVGTGPHPIDPVNVTVLHWTTPSGEEVFALHVDHPGTPAQPFLRPALSVLNRVFPPA